MSIMKIISAEQTRFLDQQTIVTEPISSIDLMERASRAFTTAFEDDYRPSYRKTYILCGPGNNGGDGLAIARMLHEAAFEVEVWLAEIGAASTDHQENLDRLRVEAVVPIHLLTKGTPFPALPPKSILIDGLFGSGLNRPIEGYWADLINYLNEQPISRIAIDVPSGLRADEASSGAIVKAEQTYTFQLPKLAFFAPENAVSVGRWQVLNIGLSAAALADLSTPNHYFPLHAAPILVKDRGRFDHKGTFGHSLIIAGSHGKIGAATLSAKAALRAGCGLVTVQVPACGYTIMQLAFPEAMVLVDPHQEIFTSPPDLAGYQAIGIGPGLGTNWLTRQALRELLEQAQSPLVLDADALNILGLHPEWQPLIPKDSILTPHPKEFERLFGPTSNSFERWQLLGEQAQRLGCYVVLKGGNTVLASPNGQLHFFTLGNPGMGTAGSGDTLTGILCGLLAQGYTPEDAAVLGLCVHGLAGDLACAEQEMEGLIAEDILNNLGRAFSQLRQMRGDR